MAKKAKLLRRFWAWYFHIVFSIIFLFFYPVFLILLRREAWYPIANRIRRIWSRTFFLFSGINPEIFYEGEIDSERPMIYCANHSSLIDIPMFPLFIRGNMFRFMAKIEFSEIPLFGIFFRSIDIGVKRESIRAAYRAYQEGKRSINNGYSLIIFPEGTSNDDDVPNLLPFKNGPFRLAIEMQVPVVPVTYLDNWYILLYHKDMYGQPGSARAIVHEPIETIGMTLEDLPRLKSMVYHCIDTQIKNEFGSQAAITG